MTHKTIYIFFFNFKWELGIGGHLTFTVFFLAFLENKNTFRESWDRVVSGSSLVSVIVTARMNLLALFSIFWPLCSTLFFFYFLSILSCASSISTRSLLRITFPSSRTFCQNCRRSESAWRTEGRRSKRFWTWIPGLPDLQKIDEFGEI